jgi:AcrR family transcriptional regulator
VQIIEEHGYDGLTIAELCRRAGVSAPSVYARVSSKEALLAAIYEHAADRLRADGVDRTHTLRAAVEAVAAHLFREARLVRAFVHRAPVDSYVRRRGSEESVALARRFRHASGGPPEVADACFRMTWAALVHRIVYGPQFESDIPLGDERFVQMLVDMAEGYAERREGSHS